MSKGVGEHRAHEAGQCRARELSPFRTLSERWNVPLGLLVAPRVSCPESSLGGGY